MLELELRESSGGKESERDGGKGANEGGEEEEVSFILLDLFQPYLERRREA